jgi:stage V sporulation protein B
MGRRMESSGPSTGGGRKASPVGQRSPTSAALTNSVILTTYYVAEAGLLFILSMLMARFLRVEEFGRLAFALSYGILLSSLDGVCLVLTKHVARQPIVGSDWIREGFPIRLYMAAAITALGLLPIVAVPYFQRNALLVALIVASEQLRGLTLTYCAWFRGFQAAKYEAAAMAVERVPLLMACLVLLRLGYGPEWVAGAFLGSRILSFTFAATTFAARFGAFSPRWRVRLLSTLVGEAYPIILLSLSERIRNNLAPFLLAWMSGEVAAAQYQAAGRIVMLPVLICGVAGGAVFAAMSQNFEDLNLVNRLYQLELRTLWHLLLPLAAVTFVLGPELSRLVFGPAYGPAGEILRILTPMYVLAALVSASYYLLTAINHERTVQRYTVLAITSNLVLGILLAHWYGAMGLAVGFLLTTVGLFVLYLIYCRGLGLQPVSARLSGVPWLGLVASGLVVLAWRHGLRAGDLTMVAGGMTVALAAYAMVVLVAGNLLPEEVRALARLRVGWKGWARLGGAE